jgi:hypothetical protein
MFGKELLALFWVNDIVWWGDKLAQIAQGRIVDNRAEGD